jgi:hypothetical protein
MIWTRPAIGRPFSKGRYIEIDNLPPLVGALGTKYVAATNELFFTRSAANKEASIWVVRNFRLPQQSGDLEGASQKVE